MMRKAKRGFVLGLAATTAMCLGIISYTPALAADKEYTYTVRIFSGDKGDFSGNEDVIVVDGLNYGDTISVYPQRDVSITDDKYYVKGVRQSGRDNNTSVTTQRAAFTVTEDQDYVISYGMLGQAVAYTVNYLDADGNILAPSETYYGNVGDRPVIAYLYVDGYQPQAYNLTRTLTEDANSNQFTFVYNPAPEGTTVTTTTTTTTTVVAGTGTGTTGGTTGATGGTTGTAGGTGTGGTGAGTGGGTGAGGEEGGVTANTPADIVDLDEGDVPLANADNTGDEGSAAPETNNAPHTLSIAAKTGIGVIMAAIIAVLIAIAAITRRRKKEEEQE